MEWTPPEDWQRITTIDAHTAGEPFRIILEGFPELQGETMLALRRDARRHHDALRRVLMWEPRGHADMYGGLIIPPVTLRSDLGVLFLHNEGFSTMCGHGIIALVTVAVELGMVEPDWPETRVRVDTPAGAVHARAIMEGERVASVAFQNVPSFAVALDQTVEVPGLGGEVSYDLAFGGAFYVYVDAASIGLECAPKDFRALVETGRAIKQAVMESREIAHPFEDDLGFLYGVIFVGPAESEDHHSRHVCVFADGEVDRSPTGTGVSGRLALLHKRGEIALDETVVIESILGTTFSGRALEPTAYGPYPAIVPEVEGRAHITGRHEFLVDPSDDLRDGFLLR